MQFSLCHNRDRIVVKSCLARELATPASGGFTYSMNSELRNTRIRFRAGHNALC